MPTGCWRDHNLETLNVPPARIYVPSFGRSGSMDSQYIQDSSDGRILSTVPV